MEQAKILKIFLASPSDVKSEREMVLALKDELDDLIGKQNSIRFEFVNWERNSYPGVGIDSQDVINQNVNDEYDIFIGIFWQRFGTPTSRAESGTKEEFDRAYSRYTSSTNSQPHIMIYFKTSPPESIYNIDNDQFEKVKKFREKIRSQGVLTFDFEKTTDLEKLLRVHLANLVKDKFSSSFNNYDFNNKNNITGEIEKVDKYEILAKKIESNNKNDTSEGILELIEKSHSSFVQIPKIVKTIIKDINAIGKKFEQRLKELNVVNLINDIRIKQKKTKQVLNKLSNNFDEYSEALNYSLPSFRENINIGIESYTKLILVTSKSGLFLEQIEEQRKTLLPELYNSMINALDGISNFLEKFNAFPIITTELAKSKRRAELVTNELFKEFINAKKLLEQLFEKRTNE